MRAARRNGRWVAPAAVLGVLMAAAAMMGRSLVIEPTYTITAQFPETPGLYTNNKVNILGVAAGKITEVVPHGSHVEVRMRLPESVRVPATAQAILMAPNPISDRSIELFPAYTGGPSLKDGANIGMKNVMVPTGVDEVIEQVDSLAKALGPDGANKQGELGSVLETVANLVDGRGQDIHDLLGSLAKALPALAGTPDQVARLITSLDKLTRVLAEHDEAIDAVFTHLTEATATVADNRATLSSAIANLESGLDAVADFLRDNQQNLTTLTSRVASVSSSLVADQQALATTFSGAATGFDGFNRGISLDARCVDRPGDACPVAFGRVIIPEGIEAFVDQYCPEPLQSALPILVNSIPGLATVTGLTGLNPASTYDTLCLAQKSIVQGHDGSPGAPPVPDLQLEQVLP